MRSWLTGIAMGAAVSVFISPHWLKSRAQYETPKKITTIENDPFGESVDEENFKNKRNNQTNMNNNNNNVKFQGQKLSIGTRLYLQGRVTARSSILFGLLFSMVGTFRCF